MPLSLKHQAFVDEYLKDRNATQATIRAGYSPNGARQTGNRLLTNHDIQSAIRSRTEKAADVADVTVIGVLRKTEAIYTAAMAAGQYGAAAKAAQMQGEYLAMFTQVHRVTLEPSEREARLKAILGLAERN